VRRLLPASLLCMVFWHCGSDLRPAWLLVTVSDTTCHNIMNMLIGLYCGLGSIFSMAVCTRSYVGCLGAFNVYVYSTHHHRQCSVCVLLLCYIRSVLSVPSYWRCTDSSYIFDLCMRAQLWCLEIRL
jgi:hypothetical protein